MRSVLGVIAIAAGVSACTDPADSIRVSDTAGPDSAILSEFYEGVMFADVCLTRGPNFEDAYQGLSGFPVTQNARTGTYYHNTANLSVKVTSAQCSMVYGTNSKVDDTVSGLAQGSASILQGPAPAGINVNSNIGPDGLRYFRLGIQSPVQ